MEADGVDIVSQHSGNSFTKACECRFDIGVVTGGVRLEFRVENESKNFFGLTVGSSTARQIREALDVCIKALEG